MPCALIRSTGGVANQFSIHLSFSLLLVSYIIMFFGQIVIEWYPAAAPFSVALAVQGEVECYFGRFEHDFLDPDGKYACVCVAWRCFSSLTITIFKNRTPSFCLIRDRRSPIHGGKTFRSHSSGHDILTLCNTRTWGVRNFIHCCIMRRYSRLILAVSRWSPHRD